MEDKLRKRVLAKITCFIILIINIFVISLFQIGCETKEYKQETIGDFIYAIGEGENCLLVSLSEEGKQKEILVFPTLVRGKKVYCGKWGGEFSSYKAIKTNFKTFKIKKILIEGELPKEIQDYYENVKFFVEAFEYEKGLNLSVKIIINYFNFSSIKLTYMDYKNKKYMRMKLYNENIFETIDYLKNVLGEDYNFERDINCLRPANVEFHWNYENSPQEDYYWIDDIEDGELIEEIPPIPEREGFIFGGWYTEKECVSEFSFSTPISKMDINWEELLNSRQQVPDEYVTSLYAKWIKI